MKRIINELKLRLPAISENEGVCRSVISAFMSVLDPSVEELADVRCAVSEAVTNCIVHAYQGADPLHSYMYISARLYDNREFSVEISDNGCGISDLDGAMHPGVSHGGDGERCGMGFLVMESFTDSLSVKSAPGKGTSVLMRKKLNP